MISPAFDCLPHVKRKEWALLNRKENTRQRNLTNAQLHKHDTSSRMVPTAISHATYFHAFAFHM